MLNRRLGVLLALLLGTGVEGWSAEERPCDPEPTDMALDYGTLLSGRQCRLAPAGDRDFFTFTGAKGEIIEVKAANLTEGEAVCLEIRDPAFQATPNGALQCAARSVFITETLRDDGTYTLIVRAASSTATPRYALLLERLFPLSPSAQVLRYDTTVTETLPHPPAIALYTFHGVAGDIIELALQNLDQTRDRRLCFEFRDPAFALVRPSSCLATAVVLLETLPTSGPYLLIVSELFNDQSAEYAVGLWCLRGECRTPCRGQPATLFGTPDDDTLRGTPGNDVIRGLGGNDTLVGRGGDDLLCGEAGDDRLLGGAGNDGLDGGPGEDTCVGGPGEQDRARRCEATETVP